MRISDWSSDVCSSDLDDQRRAVEADRNPGDAVLDPVAYVIVGVAIVARDDADAAAAVDVRETGRRAVCRIMRIERVGLIGERRIIAVSGRDRKRTRLNSSH